MIGTVLLLPLRFGIGGYLLSDAVPPLRNYPVQDRTVGQGGAVFAIQRARAAR